MPPAKAGSASRLAGCRATHELPGVTTSSGIWLNVAENCPGHTVGEYHHVHSISQLSCRARGVNIGPNRALGDCSNHVQKLRLTERSP